MAYTVPRRPHGPDSCGLLGRGVDQMNKNFKTNCKCCLLIDSRYLQLILNPAELHMIKFWLQVGGEANQDTV